MKTKAIIYLGDQRGRIENEWMRSMLSFNFGSYKAGNREPFGRLQVFNEDVLASGKSLQMLVEEDTEVIIIPLVGTLLFKDNNHNEIYVEPGTVQLFSAAKLNSYTITNPYEKNELVNFLQVWLNKNNSTFTQNLQQFSFNLAHKNQLHNIILPDDLNQPAFCYIGKYEGRKKDVYHFHNSNSGIYAFVVEGAFEVQDRLLHAKDGLAIWDANEIDFEALSNDAILLLLELANI
jgi:redox-sensitive bicupin YhaK (pirin superfamily)